MWAFINIKVMLKNVKRYFMIDFHRFTITRMYSYSTLVGTDAERDMWGTELIQASRLCWYRDVMRRSENHMTRRR